MSEHLASFDWGNVIEAWVCLLIGGAVGVWFTRPVRRRMEVKPCYCGEAHDGWALIAQVRADLEVASRKDADSRKSGAAATACDGDVVDARSKFESVSAASEPDRTPGTDDDPAA